ncbi:1-deoxy-D-xylulose-5-phosphate reductoisomerase [Haloimpatiens lingqiaonensis]|uniref:1-deoxy-D-xylulose-5-phosphate reductoisomerase n=1 Tax=Haloimpatiens lingqiaonensis TaxID=1380675 RepID=UPI0010FE4F81|nr:1-deoxy-D-xylulose-5-phosphate reductoisomerase [Haloimpatiens lingqiaonensis]
MKNITILGATGSIGTQTLDVIRKERESFCLKGISANKSYHKIIEIIEEFNVPYAVMMDKEAYEKVRDYCKGMNLNTKVLYGMEGLKFISTLEEVNTVVTSVVGMIGLIPTIEAIKAKKDIALANKETLVVAGEIVKREALKNNINILPVDSEHGAIFQCLQGNKKEDINKILLTASGGPFKGKTKEQLKNITPLQALKHPKWNMGKKISIDSSTLMNKGLEVIEAHWLFDVDYDNIQVVVHPQSIIHSMIEYIDGSIIAQLADPDMKLPIQYALNYPIRKNKVINSLDFYTLNTLTFEKPDMNTFGCLRLAYEAGKIGGLMPTVLNSANEVVVDLFLREKIGYLQIEDIIEHCLGKFNNIKEPEIEDILNMDNEVRKYIYSTY